MKETKAKEWFLKQARHTKRNHYSESMSCNPIPSDFKELLRAAYFNPSDPTPYLVMADYLAEYGTTIVEYDYRPWKWMCYKAFWEAMGQPVPHGMMYPLGGKVDRDWDHTGRTVIYQIESYISEPYHSVEGIIDQFIMKHAPNVDAVFAVSPNAWHHPNCNRIMLMNPETIIEKHERRQNVINRPHPAFFE